MACNAPPIHTTKLARMGIEHLAHSLNVGLTLALCVHMAIQNSQLMLAVGMLTSEFQKIRKGR
ncbi:MAG: hypothetical protein PSN37_01965 [Alphaproteobacteria bacterium]|nr:hypothetical protein [Alphaproteobacteria bacterium]